MKQAPHSVLASKHVHLTVRSIDSSRKDKPRKCLAVIAVAGVILLLGLLTVAVIWRLNRA